MPLPVLLQVLHEGSPPGILPRGLRAIALVAKVDLNQGLLPDIRGVIHAGDVDGSPCSPARSHLLQHPHGVLDAVPAEVQNELGHVLLVGVPCALPVGTLHNFLQKLRAEAVPGQRHLRRVPRLFGHPKLLHEANDLLLDDVVLVVREALKATVVELDHLRLSRDADELHDQLYGLSTPLECGLAARGSLLAAEVGKNRVAAKVYDADREGRNPCGQQAFQSGEAADSLQRLAQGILDHVTAGEAQLARHESIIQHL
mmetsp:Transcript_25853/g.57061  ORF Transcript_25853/g.57061 Transcript_25853/m.57061 type:complete len:257 (-) Transcript_25853:165-935(-)